MGPWGPAQPWKRPYRESRGKPMGLARVAPATRFFGDVIDQLDIYDVCNIQGTWIQFQSN